MKRDLKHVGRGHLLAAGALVGAAAALRFWDLPRVFLYGRDDGLTSLAERAMFVQHHLYALTYGPPEQLPNFNEGPFYYWLMAPFQLAFRLHPFADAFGVALLSTLMVGLAWLWAVRIWGAWPALAAGAIAAFAIVLDGNGRFGWNPNPLPFLLMLVLFALPALGHGGLWRAVTAGLAVAATTQLHATGLFAVPAAIAWLLWERPPRWRLKGAVSAAAGVALWLPWLGFNSRHDWIMVRSALSALRARQVPGAAPGGAGTLGSALLQAGHEMTQLPGGAGLALIGAGICAVAWFAARGPSGTRGGARALLCLNLAALAEFALLRGPFLYYYLLPWLGLVPVTLAALPAVAGYLPQLRGRAVMAAAAGIALLGALALPADAAEPGREAACGYDNLEASVLAVTRAAGSHPYRLELWSPYPWDADHVANIQGLEYILVWHHQPAPDDGAPVRYAIAMAAIPGPDVGPELRTLLANQPQARVLHRAGCYAALSLPSD